MAWRGTRKMYIWFVRVSGMGVRVFLLFSGYGCFAINT